MLRDKRGSTFVYVIMLLALLTVTATGFLYINRFNMSTTTNHYRKLQQNYLAKSIHRTVCEQAEAGRLEILQEILKDVISNTGDHSGDEYSYYATTGEQLLTLSSGDSLTVKLDITCGFEPDEENGTAQLDTYMKFDGGDPYQMTALFFLEHAAGQLSENSKWVVERHYQTGKDE